MLARVFSSVQQLLRTYSSGSTSEHSRHADGRRPIYFLNMNAVYSCEHLRPTSSALYASAAFSLRQRLEFCCISLDTVFLLKTSSRKVLLPDENYFACALIY